jgi:hypothetical protein
VLLLLTLFDFNKSKKQKRNKGDVICFAVSVLALQNDADYGITHIADRRGV